MLFVCLFVFPPFYLLGTGERGERGERGKRGEGKEGRGLGKWKRKK